MMTRCNSSGLENMSALIFLNENQVLRRFSLKDYIQEQLSIVLKVDFSHLLEFL